MSQADTNKDGTIEPAEFVRWAFQSSDTMAEQTQGWASHMEACDEKRKKEAEQKRLEAMWKQKAIQKGEWRGLRVGSEVLLIGLTKAPSFNGRRGKIEAWIDETGRWKVCLDDGNRKNILPENLEFFLEEDTSKPHYDADERWMS